MENSNNTQRHLQKNHAKTAAVDAAASLNANNTTADAVEFSTSSADAANAPPSSPSVVTTSIANAQNNHTTADEFLHSLREKEESGQIKLFKTE